MLIASMLSDEQRDFWSKTFRTPEQPSHHWHWPPKGHGFEPHLRHCVVVLEQDTFILA